jgi:large subunit ribosomal protein L25
LVDLVLNGRKTAVLIKEVQRKVVSGQIIHVDLNAVDLTQDVQVLVPINLVGEQSKDIANRVLVHNLREVEVRCLPTSIPEFIEADVSALQIGESFKAEQLALPEGVSLVTDPEATIVSAIVAKVVEAAVETEDEVTEPEVVGTKADDDEDSEK